jgi:hypothetical protein
MNRPPEHIDGGPGALFDTGTAADHLNQHDYPPTKGVAAMHTVPAVRTVRRPSRRQHAASQIHRATGVGGWVTVRTADKPQPRKQKRAGR